jgi:hypothetical protein
MKPKPITLLAFLVGALGGCDNSIEHSNLSSTATPEPDTVSVYFSGPDAANGLQCGGKPASLICLENCSTHSIREWLPDSIAQINYYGGIIVDMVAVVQPGDALPVSIQPAHILSIRNYSIQDTACVKTRLLVCGTEPFWQLVVPELSDQSLYETDVSTFSLLGLEMVGSLRCTTPNLLLQSPSDYTLQFTDVV